MFDCVCQTVDTRALQAVSPLCFQRLGHFAPLPFTAVGGKIQATRCADGRWLNNKLKLFLLLLSN